MKLDTIDRARGHWREILPRFGVDARFLSNKHGPCPLCGGKDRFRFDDKNGDGTYYCNQCGPGVGLLLIRKLRAWDHKTACDAIDQILGNPTPTAPPIPASKNASANAAALDLLLREARYPDVVAAWLKRRGLRVTSPVLNGHWRCPYYDDGKLIGTFPAVIAPIHGPDGSLQSAQRIYTGDLGGRKRKKTMPPVDTISGGAIRLHPPNDELGVAEGVATALAAHQLFGVPVWALLSADNLKKFEPPLGISHLRIFGDNDASYTGQEAAYALGRRLCAKRLQVEVQIAPNVGTDWADVLNSKSGS